MPQRGSKSWTTKTATLAAMSATVTAGKRRVGLSSWSGITEPRVYLRRRSHAARRGLRRLLASTLRVPYTSGTEMNARKRQTSRQSRGDVTERARPPAPRAGGRALRVDAAPPRGERPAGGGAAHRPPAGGRRVPLPPPQGDDGRVRRRPRDLAGRRHGARRAAHREGRRAPGDGPGRPARRPRPPRRRGGAVRGDDARRVARAPRRRLRALPRTSTPTPWSPSSATSSTS